MEAKAEWFPVNHALTFYTT